MKLNKILLPLLIILTACSEGVPEFTRLNSLSGIQFKGQEVTTLLITELGPQLTLEGSCDRSTDRVLISTDDGKTWSDGQSLMGHRLELSCKIQSHIRFTFLTDNKGLIQFNKNEASKSTIRVIARSGKISASEAQIILDYQPQYKAPTPLAGTFISPSSGVTASTNYKMQFRVKAANVKAASPNFKIKTIQ
ncbi:MAG: hypothetical protein KDD58_05950 [Bdellovibrionales bacterium]|nr:hypothetical protein [Bdellovibrionales bacterium]